MVFGSRIFKVFQVNTVPTKKASILIFFGIILHRMAWFLAYNQFNQRRKKNRFMDDIVVIVESKQANIIHIFPVSCSVRHLLSLSPFLWISFYNNLLNFVCGFLNLQYFTHIKLLTCSSTKYSFAPNYTSCVATLFSFSVPISTWTTKQHRKQTNCRKPKLDFPLFCWHKFVWVFEHCTHTITKKARNKQTQHTQRMWFCFSHLLKKIW